MKNSDFPSVQSVMDDLTGRTSQKAARVEPAPEQLAVRRVDAASSGSAMPQIPPHTLAKIKRLKRRRFVMKWLQKLPWLKP